MSEDGRSFDRRLLRARRARFAASFAEHEFLIAHVATRDRRADRGGACATSRWRSISAPIMVWSGRSVAALPTVGAMIYADSTFELAARCPRPTLVCDEDLLPFQEPSLNLIVSGLALHRVNDLPGALIQIRRRFAPTVSSSAALLGARSLIELRQALLEAEAEIGRRREPAHRSLRRCQGLWRAAAARGLRAARDRRRDRHSDLRLACAS